MGTGFCISALRTGVSAEGMIAPSGITVSVQFASASITRCIIAVHIPVFVGIDGLRVGVGTFFLISADGTFVGTVEAVIVPSGISPSFSDRAAFRTLGLIAVHLLVFDGVYFRVAMGAGGKHRHRQDGHNHQNGEKRTQNF